MLAYGDRNTAKASLSLLNEELQSKLQMKRSKVGMLEEPGPPGSIQTTEPLDHVSGGLAASLRSISNLK